MKNNSIIKKIKSKNWEIFWEIPECPPFLTSEPARFFTKQMKDFCGKNFNDCILEYRNNTNIWYLDESQWSKLDKNLFNRMLKDITWARKINTISEKYCIPCFKYLDLVRNTNYKKLPDKELANHYENFMKIYVPAHGSGHPANVLEMKNQRLSKHLKIYILNKRLDTKVQGTADELFSILTEPLKDMSLQLEAKSFYKLALEILKYPNVQKIIEKNNSKYAVRIIQSDYPKIWKKIVNHEKSWCWTIYNWEGPANTTESYINSLGSVFRQNLDISQELKKIQNRSKIVFGEQIVLFKKLEVDSKYKKLFKIASDIMFMKSLRKDCMYKGSWATEPMYTEISKRLGISLHEARFIFYFEMKKAILSQKIDKEIIQSRTKEVIMHQRSGKLDIILHGKEALKFVDSLKVKKPDKNIKEIKGQVAYKGVVRGIVKYVNTPDMMYKMNKGDILIAYATQPNLLPAMKKAAAFVTDFGGITCHAAIVAREWKVPCVIGTSIATKVLKDGDLVEVDANTGVVKILKKSK